MKTAELQVEHVLIGAVVLATGLVPWLPELSRWVEHHDNALNLVGIMFDRLADTLTEPLERHQRLRFGLRQRFIIAMPSVSWPCGPGGESRTHTGHTSNRRAIVRKGHRGPGRVRQP
jgi:hypothetical protein